MKLTIHSLIAGLALLLVAAALGAASDTQAAPKPGFVPGKWTGVGTISGSAIDGPMTVEYSGQIRFTLIVKPDRSVTGSGIWRIKQVGSGSDTKNVMEGAAPLKFTGASNDVNFTGKGRAKGTITASGPTFPIDMSFDVAGRLVIKKARDCTASGTVPRRGESGATVKWAAKRAIKGTCNA